MVIVLFCSVIDSFLLCSFVTTNTSKGPFHYLSAIQTKNLSRDYSFCSQEGRAPGADDGAHDGFTNKVAKVWELLTISWQWSVTVTKFFTCESLNLSFPGLFLSYNKSKEQQKLNITWTIWEESIFLSLSWLTFQTLCLKDYPFWPFFQCLNSIISLPCGFLPSIPPGMWPLVLGF